MQEAETNIRLLTNILENQKEATEFYLISVQKKLGKALEIKELVAVKNLFDVLFDEAVVRQAGWAAMVSYKPMLALKCDSKKAMADLKAYLFHKVQAPAELAEELANKAKEVADRFANQCEIIELATAERDVSAEHLR